MISCKNRIGWLERFCNSLQHAIDQNDLDLLSLANNNAQIKLGQLRRSIPQFEEQIKKHKKLESEKRDFMISPEEIQGEKVKKLTKKEQKEEELGHPTTEESMRWWEKLPDANKKEVMYKYGFALVKRSDLTPSIVREIYTNHLKKIIKPIEQRPQR